MKKLIILLLLILAIGCQTEVIEKGDSPIKKFESENEIKEFLLKSANLGLDYQASFVEDGMVFAEASPNVIRKSSSDFSTTNVQVKGVDESDFIKNDGKYIYMISDKDLLIMDAYPAENSKIISREKLGDRPRNLLLYGDKLIVLVEENKDLYSIPEFDFAPRRRFSTLTKVITYDVSDRTNPKITNEIEIDGNFFQARMIDEYIYLVTQKYADYSRPFMPEIIKNGKMLIKPDVFHFNNNENSYNFNTITSLNVKSEEVEAKTFLMGYSNTLYVSEDNIYIAYQKNYPYHQDSTKDRFFKVVVPILNLDVSKDDSWADISAKMENKYNRVDEEEKNSIQKKIEKALEEYDTKIEADRRKSVIHKIKIDRGEIDYKARGEIPGYLLNQFSLDEHDGNLRVATTTNLWRGINSLYNNVFVLDEEMEIIGKIEDIAPDEKIYSTRFMGDKLYMVTFKRVDPFFVISLEDPRNPKILGELKIPGFSDYLHPYDENHIIGLGKETEANDWGGVSTKGLKIALFDVSDVNNPKQVSKIEIGEPGTDSEALRDHKAFLFDKEKDILVIPVREVLGRVKEDYYYRWDVRQAAYVFSLKDGIKVRGKVAHKEGVENTYWGSPDAVRRSLYMDDVLYTISSKKVVMSSFDGEKINDVKLN